MTYPTPKIQTDLKEAFFTIRTWQEYETWIDFEVLRIVSIELGTEKICWESQTGSPIDDIEKAEIFMSGTIKWDGCTDYRMPSDCNHSCGRYHIQGLVELWNALYDLAIKTFPEHADLLT